jgi:hypothetical protein
VAETTLAELRLMDAYEKQIRRVERVIDLLRKVKGPGRRATLCRKCRSHARSYQHAEKCLGGRDRRKAGGVEKTKAA